MSDEAGDATAAPNSAGMKWVAASGGEVPDGAFAGGDDSGVTLYVARANHEEALVPGKVVSGHDCCYIPWGGEEHSKDAYEVLVVAPESVSWADSTGETIPANAVEGGKSVEGEILYVGRAAHEGTLTVGKFHPSHGCVYISYGGKEIAYPEFQVLVLN